MRKTYILYIFILVLAGCSKNQTAGVKIVTTDGRPELYIDGKLTYIKGVGGEDNIAMAKESGANAFRTWDTRNIQYYLKEAKKNDMYIMMGIKLSKSAADYYDEIYKDEVRKEVKALAETHKNDPYIFAWGIGNEINILDANIDATWLFVEELAQLIKSVDKRHLVTTVISHSEAAVKLAIECAPSLDFISINSYGKIGQVENIFNNLNYAGAFMITEWGVTGFWQTPKTEWDAPVEETSEEKRAIFEKRYNDYISKYKNCIGSFVFLWGQKEERTPTWNSMFVEKGVEGLPLNGEKTPMVEAMQRVWNQIEPAQTAPVIKSFFLNQAIENVAVPADELMTGEVVAVDRENDKLTYIWEILEEASILGIGGSYEPRPKRVGDVVTTDGNTCSFSVPQSGYYRLYVYVSDNTGFVATANIPFQVR